MGASWIEKKWQEGEVGLRGGGISSEVIQMLPSQRQQEGLHQYVLVRNCHKPPNYM